MGITVPFPTTSHEDLGFSVTEAAQFLVAHDICMWAPSPLTTMLLNKIGSKSVLILGHFVYFLTMLQIFLVPTIPSLLPVDPIVTGSFMIMLALGWNLLLMGATEVMNESLACQRLSEVTLIKSINELSVNGCTLTFMVVALGLPDVWKYGPIIGSCCMMFSLAICCRSLCKGSSQVCPARASGKTSPTCSIEKQNQRDDQPGKLTEAEV